MAVPTEIPREWADPLLTTLLIFAPVLHTKCRIAGLLGAGPSRPNGGRNADRDDE
jgi:hypothetical protein